MKPVTMYTTMVCPFCTMAKRLLASKGITDIQEIRIDQDPAERDAMMARTGRRTVPQIFVGEQHIGGFTDFYDFVINQGL